MCNTSLVTARHVRPFRPVKPSKTLLLCLLSLPLSCLAAGLGELSVHSSLGEPLRAEIPVSAGPDDRLDSSCFHLETIREAELPVISRGKLMLETLRGGLLLHIVGSGALKEPLAMLRIRTSCGAELQRDYFVMPQLPDSRMTTWNGEANPAAATSKRPEQTPTPPGKLRRAASPQEEKTQSRPHKANPPLRQLVREQPRRSDRLIVSDSLDSLAGPSDSATSDTEEQLLRMETSLARLNESLQALEQAIDLQSQAVNARHELQLAMILEEPPAAGLLSNSTLTDDKGSSIWRQWLELMFGTLVGGALSALLLQRVGRLLTPDSRDR